MNLAQQMQSRNTAESATGHAHTIGAAYDLAAYDVRNGQHRVKILSAVTKKRNLKQIKSMLVSAALCGCLILSVGGILLSNSRLNEVTAQAAKLKRENDTLIVEQRRLQALYDVRIDIKEVERIAIEELYMQPVEQAQIVYIDLSKEDMGFVIADERSAMERIVDKLSDCWTLVQQIFRT